MTNEKKSQAKIGRLEKSNKILKGSEKTLRQTITTLNDDIERQIKKSDSLTSELEKSKKENDELKKRLEKAEGKENNNTHSQEIESLKIKVVSLERENKLFHQIFTSGPFTNKEISEIKYWKQKAIELSKLLKDANLAKANSDIQSSEFNNQIAEILILPKK